MADDHGEQNCECALPFGVRGSVCYVLFLAGNYLSADAASEHEVTVTVLDKRMEQHEKGVG